MSNANNKKKNINNHNIDDNDADDDNRRSTKKTNNKTNNKKKSNKYAVMRNDESSMGNWNETNDIVREAAAATIPVEDVKSKQQQKVSHPSSSKSSPLAKTPNNNNNTKRFIQLYDYDCMIEIDLTIACGYITLLSGGTVDGLKIYNNKKRNKKSSRSELQQPNQIQIHQTHSSGGSSSATTTATSMASLLSFASIIDGNVIEACFGISSNTKKHNNHKPPNRSIQERLVKDAKTAICDAVHINDTLKTNIIIAYQNAFQCIVNYHCDLKSIPYIIRCTQIPTLRRNVSISLHNIFESIEYTIQDTL